jgi:uncharacterized membrane protein YhaH (DUF805 family)
MENPRTGGRPLAAAVVTAAALSAALAFTALGRFDNYVQVLGWWLLILVLALAGLGLAVRTWKQTRTSAHASTPQGAATTVSVVCAVICSLLITGTLAQLLVLPLSGGE